MIPRLIRTLRKRNRWSGDDIGDAVHEAYLRHREYIYPNRLKDCPETFIKILQIAMGLLHSTDKRRSKYIPIDLNSAEDENLLPKEFHVAECATAKLILGELERYIPQNFKLLFKLRYLQGYKECEIAETLGMSLNIVKKRMQKLKLWLKDHKDEFYPPPTLTMP